MYGEVNNTVQLSSQVLVLVLILVVLFNNVVSINFVTKLHKKLTNYKSTMHFALNYKSERYVFYSKRYVFRENVYFAVGNGFLFRGH